MAKRKNSTKKERTELLKKLGLTEADMNKIWSELVEIKHGLISNLDKAGLNWTDMTIYQIEQLPDLKEKTLKDREERAKEEELKKAEEDKKRKEEEYYNENREQILLDKITNKLVLSEDEICDLIMYFEVDRIYGDNDDWTRPVRTIVELDSRYFEIDWEEGLTECQENIYMNQPFEVELYTSKRLVEIKNWVLKGSSKQLDDTDDDTDKLIDKITEFMYCNFGDCGMREISWEELNNVRKYIKENMKMV